jgi:hypothetical protein
MLNTILLKKTTSVQFLIGHGKILIKMLLFIHIAGVGVVILERSYLANEQYEILYNETHHYIIMHWKAYIHGDEYREAVLKGIECLTEKKYHKWLIDSNSLIVVNDEDQAWLLKEWIKAAENSGLKYIAAILPRNKLGLSIVEKMDLHPSTNLFIKKFFENEAEAVDWLRSLT